MKRFFGVLVIFMLLASSVNSVSACGHDCGNCPGSNDSGCGQSQTQNDDERCGNHDNGNGGNNGGCGGCNGGNCSNGK